MGKSKTFNTMNPDDDKAVSFQQSHGKDDLLATASERPRTPRELLRKMPRRVSICQTTTSPGSQGDAKLIKITSASPTEPVLTQQPSEGNKPVLSRAHPTPSPSPTPTAVSTSSAEDSAARSQCQGKVSSSPQQQQAPVKLAVSAPVPPAAAIPKPAPTRPKAAPFVHPGAAFMHKPADPAQEMMARKALMLQSRRKVGLGKAPTVATANKPRTTMPQSGRAPLVPPQVHHQQLRQQQQPHMSSLSSKKCLPIGGFLKNGQFLFTGIVLRKGSLSSTGHVKAVFVKLDDPKGPMTGHGHKMGDLERLTELALYEGMNYKQDIKMRHLAVMDLGTGRPPSPTCNSATPHASAVLVPMQGSMAMAMARQPMGSPSSSAFTGQGGGGLPFLSPIKLHPSQQLQNSQQRPACSSLQQVPFSNYHHGQAAFHFPVQAPMQAVQTNAANIARTEATHSAPSFGLAEIKGKEAFFYADPDTRKFDQCFPYVLSPASSSSNGSHVAGGSFVVAAQRIRSGDKVKVMLCGRSSDGKLIHEELWVQVISVTSWGQISGCAISFGMAIERSSCSRYFPLQAMGEVLVFPSTVVIGVQHGTNWASTRAKLSKVAAAKKKMQMQGK